MFSKSKIIVFAVLGLFIFFGGQEIRADSYIEVPGVGNLGEGAGIAFTNLDGDSRPEMVLMAYDAPAGPNNFRYKIGWNIRSDGRATSWSNFLRVDGVGHMGDGAGIAFTNLDTNPRPEMVLMAYDAPEGANNFRYKIGWNIKSDGTATSWSPYKIIDGVGHMGDGAGIAFTNLDANPRPEMVLMAYDAPAGPNNFRYKIGWDLNENGETASWTYEYISVNGVGNEGDGAGVAFANFDTNPSPEMIIMAYDDPAYANGFRYRIGWNIGNNGRATSWDTNYTEVAGVGHMGDGAGIAFANIDNDSRQEMFLMAYDAPEGAANNFRYIISRNVTSECDAFRVSEIAMADPGGEQSQYLNVRIKFNREFDASTLISRDTVRIVYKNRTANIMASNLNSEFQVIDEYTAIFSCTRTLGEIHNDAGIRPIQTGDVIILEITIDGVEDTGGELLDGDLDCNPGGAYFETKEWIL